jgi:hypothetical protein
VAPGNEIFFGWRRVEYFEARYMKKADFNDSMNMACKDSTRMV